jgi:hypothetical protein
MYLGAYRLGDVVPIPHQAVGASFAPANPTAAPVYSVYAADGTEVEADKKMPVLGVGNTGLFLAKNFLDGDYAAGRYCVRIESAVSGTTRAWLLYFNVKPGGNAKGAYRSLTFYDKTGGEYVVGETDSNELEIRRGPYL